MSCKCGCGGLPRADFMHRLISIREEAVYEMPISSGFRCPLYNKKVSTSGLNGPHTLGLAADVRVFGYRALRLIELARKEGMTGFGVSQKGAFEQRFIHLDCVEASGSFPRPTMWSY